MPVKDKAIEAKFDPYPTLYWPNVDTRWWTTFLAGVVMAGCCIFARLVIVQNQFTNFQWGSAIETSREYRMMLAWIDIYNLGMYTGVAIILIALFGWRHVKPQAENSETSTTTK